MNLEIGTKVSDSGVRAVTLLLLAALFGLAVFTLKNYGDPFGAVFGETGGTPKDYEFYIGALAVNVGIFFAGACCLFACPRTRRQALCEWFKLPLLAFMILVLAVFIGITLSDGYFGSSRSGWKGLALVFWGILWNWLIVMAGPCLLFVALSITSRGARDNRSDAQQSPPSSPVLFLLIISIALTAAAAVAFLSVTEITVFAVVLILLFAEVGALVWCVNLRRKWNRDRELHGQTAN